MFEFSCWCFLCAGEIDVNVEILGLDEQIRESIGQFSIINFTLTGVPSKICQDCHSFLKDFEKRKIRYSLVEQMLMELLKMRNKSFDLTTIKAKYGLTEQHSIAEELPDASFESHEFVINDIIEEVSFPRDQVGNIDSDKKVEGTAKEKATPEMRTARKSLKIEAPTSSAPKILNPTIHQNIPSDTQMKLFQCDLCVNASSSKVLMERHMQTHMQPANAFSCSTCSKTFSKKNVLQIHEKVHLNQGSTFSCPQCSKALSSKTAVANHIKWLHKKSKEFECSACSKKFATKGSLKEHEKIHSDFKGHVCPLCNKSYKTASTLTQHLDTHGETEYHCSLCKLRLNSKRTLRQHMLKHSDIIRHTCEVCNAQFKRTKAYKEHLISQHTGIKAYSCEWCLKKFSNGANCRKHKKEAHPVELAEADKNETKKVVKLPKINELLSMTLERLKTK